MQPNPGANRGITIEVRAAIMRMEKHCYPQRIAEGCQQGNTLFFTLLPSLQTLKSFALLGLLQQLSWRSLWLFSLGRRPSLVFL